MSGSQDALACAALMMAVEMLSPAIQTLDGLQHLKHTPMPSSPERSALELVGCQLASPGSAHQVLDLCGEEDRQALLNPQSPANYD